MRLIFLILICLFSFGVQAARTARTRTRSPKTIVDMRHALDMKVFHDSTYVKDMIKGIYDQQKSGISSNPDLMKEMGHEGLFTKKDSDIIRQEAARKVVRTKLMATPWEDEEKQIDEDPFNAFMALIEDDTLPNLKQKELDNLNSVDKTVIPEMNMMMGESGPDIGGTPVSVVYEENINLK